MSSTTQSQQTSASDDSTIIDIRKRKRMISNRESARRSRMRKQQHLDELINQVTQLKNENSQIMTQIDMLTQQFLVLDGANSILKMQIMELTERLKSLNAVLRFVEEFSGLEMDIQEVPDPLLQPWHLPCLAQPVMVSANNMLQF